MACRCGYKFCMTSQQKQKVEMEKKSGLSDSNQRPRDTSSFPLGVILLQSHALPTELRPVDETDPNLLLYIPS